MRATLLHNPGAGLSKPTKEDLIDALSASGYKVKYQSTKEKGINWEEISRSSDVIVVAGGDGTVGKISRKLVGCNVPIGILPVGTANNIATSIGVKEPYNTLIPRWSLSKKKKLSAGVAEGVWGRKNFVESTGYGLFSYLMKEIYDDHPPREKASSEEEINFAVLRLLKMLEEYKPKPYQIEVDGKDLSGEYLMVEVMNIKCIGPNLMLAPIANHEDDEFEVVLIGKNEKEHLVDYFKSILQKQHIYLNVPYHSGRNIRMQSTSCELHIDDEVVSATKGELVKITISPHALEFLVV
ncbi:MAG TPA: diacylglycerol kinase family protein [Cytophagales bacterium]|nr:diacylglycerol kinase family protein [Cytophagales bacterium]